MVGTAKSLDQIATLEAVDARLLVQLHDQMLLIRRFEEKVNEMYTRAKIGGYCHLNIGEEGAIVGSMSALGEADYIFAGYREHGHALARGLDPKGIMAELFGKATGVSRGRGGSMHLFDAGRRFMGGYAIVGGHLPIAVGAAMAIRYREGSEAVATYLGEGATNAGAFHESLNVAKLWRLPIIFIVLNNQYEMGTPVAKTSAVPEQYKKGATYGMHGEQVDGMDVLAVREATLAALRRAREDEDPSILELVAYRFRGHSVIDPARYRTEEELRSWLARDPIESFRQKLSAAGLLTEDHIEAAEQRIGQQVAEAVAFAEASPFPDPSTLFDYLYVGEGGR
ncbi:MAG: pyruvate dehydrogenase (acetyl-transferring) E1 component subunit alpha [Chloroflexi bacterium]|nr:pyruvate dehydrogenase (acetyl-transferring) E1 component subunit alpha [Chloroflexota bacterium]